MCFFLGFFVQCANAIREPICSGPPSIHWKDKKSLHFPLSFPELGVQELDVPIVVRPLSWFFCLLKHGSFHFVPCIPPFFGVHCFIYDSAGFHHSRSPESWLEKLVLVQSRIQIHEGKEARSSKRFTPFAKWFWMGGNKSMDGENYVYTRGFSLGIVYENGWNQSALV
jgi:hypothetical protein